MLPEKTKTQRPMTNNKTSMTLVELIMASVILCVIIAGIGVVMNLSIRAYDFVTTETSKQGNVKVATEHLLKYIKNSSYCKAVDGTTLALYGRSHESLGTYTVSSDKKLIFTKPTGNPQIISENTLLTFAEEAGDPGQAREIRIDFSQPINQTTYISCRLTLPNTWAKTFGGNGSASCIQKTSDGGYIIAGSTQSFGAGGGDVYIIKIDEFGNYLWSKTFGGGRVDYANSIQKTTDGGYIIAGDTQSFGAGLFDAYLIKTDEFGNHQWSKTFGGSYIDSAASIQQTSDGGYIIAGNIGAGRYGRYDAYLIKTDEFGNHQWSKTFGGSSYDYARSIQKTTDGGYIIAGDTISFGAGLADAYLIKTDEFGNHLWSKTFGGSNNEIAYSIQQVSDGGYIIAGYTQSFGAGGLDAYLIKTDEFGNHQWSKTFGGSNNEIAYSIQQISNGGYIIAGYTGSFGAGGRDAYLIKTDEFGNHQWSKTFGGSSYDRARSIQKTTDGGYIIAGNTMSFGAGLADAYIIKTDEHGNCPQAASPTAVSNEPTAEEHGTPIHVSATPEHDSSIPEHENAVPVHDPGAPS
jgi:hypothetical protein